MKNLFKKLVFSGIAFALFGGYFAFPAFADTIRSLPQYIITKNEGSQITARTTSLDFVGSGVNATVSGNDVTVTVSSAGSLSNFSFTNANGFEGTVTDASSTPNLTLTTGLSLNSIPFIDASGGLLDDTANLVWDNSNDRLGLGTPSPSVRLDVRRSGTGEIAYFLDSSLNGVIYGTDTNLGYLTSSSGLTGLGFGINGGTYALRINPSGYIGIGTATPASTVDIVSNQTVPLYIRSTRTISYNQIQTSDTGYNTTYDGFTFGINGIDAYFYNRENAKIYFGTNDNARMIINANGYISMGTNANFRQLAVYDAANGQGALYGYSSQTGASYYSGNLILGSSSSYMGSIDYGYGADSIFAFSNTQNNNSARIDFKLKNAGTPVTPLSIKGSGQVGFSTTSPDGSALVDMVSTTSGILIPRMTTTQKNAIGTPAEGLQVFDIDINTPFFYDVDQTRWKQVSETYSDTYTPTLTGVTNVAGSTAYVTGYTRTHKSMTISGKIEVTASTNNAQTTIGISNPITSDFTNVEDCGGTAYTQANSVAGHGAALYADTANDRIEMDYYETHGAMDTFSFTVTCQIK